MAVAFALSWAGAAGLVWLGGCGRGGCQRSFCALSGLGQNVWRLSHGGGLDGRVGRVVGCGCADGFLCELRLSFVQRGEFK